MQPSLQLHVGRQLDQLVNKSNAPLVRFYVICEWWVQFLVVVNPSFFQRGSASGYISTKYITHVYAGGWREWGDIVQTQVVPITPPWSAQCCDQAGSSNAACPTGRSSPICTPSVTSLTPGTPKMTPTSGRSCCTCQSRGSLDNFFPFRSPGALFNPFFPPPPFPMHPQIAAAAGFPSPPPGVGPEQYLGRDPAPVQECAQHRSGNGVAAAAAMQYQNESESLLFDSHSKQVPILPACVMITESTLGTRNRFHASVDLIWIILSFVQL